MSVATDAYAGHVYRQNGAWLIDLFDPTGESTPDATYSCAASITTAKRVAVKMAQELGFEGMHRWTRHNASGAWSLAFARYGRDDEESE